MKKYQILFAALPLLVVTGCGKSIADRVAEKAIENQTGGKVQINTDKNSVKINNGTGATYEAGENVKLPDNFPKDVYVVDGKILSAVTDVGKETYSVSIQTDKSAADVTNAYQEKFKNEGWKITGTMNFGNSATVVAEKEGRQASVFVSSDDKNTTVVLTTGKK